MSNQNDKDWDQDSTDDANQELEGLQLSDIDKEILDELTEDEREIVVTVLHRLDPDNLTVESIRTVIAEKNFIGNLGNSLVNVARENEDLRQKVKSTRQLIIYLAIGLIASSILLAVVIYAWVNFPKYTTVQTVDNSVICEISPESNPLLTDVAIEDFAKNAVLSAYSFDYVDYRNQINSSTTRFFTTDGRAAFNRALRSSGSLDHIVNNNLIMKAHATQGPQIEEKGLDQFGKPYWIVRMPIRTEFYTGASNPVDREQFIAQVRIVTAQRDAFNPRGLGVHSLTLRPAQP